jgi:arabinosyltransferase C
MLAGVGLAAILAGRERGVRNLVAIFGLAMLSGTSLRWFFRDLSLIKENVSNTTVHALYLTPNVQQIVKKLDQVSGRTVLLAMPGVAMPSDDPDRFGSPYIPDLNAVMSGLSGVYSYAGHWSETPHYVDRRNEATLFYVRMDNATRSAFIRDHQISYLLAPVPEAFPAIFTGKTDDVRELGTTVVDGNQFRLIQVQP